MLAQPAIDVAIVGARNPSQLEQTARASDKHLTQDTLQEIERTMLDQQTMAALRKDKPIIVR